MSELEGFAASGARGSIPTGAATPPNPPSSGLTHWGLPAADVLEAHGVDTIFTLSGGHLFFLYDATEAKSIRLLDVRHEATAAFAAEAWGRLRRDVGVAAVTAGPGVFNVVNGLATAQKNNSPLVVIGGRAPSIRWGMGSLQEVDHVPVAASLCKAAFTATEALGAELSNALSLAMTAPRGPVFLDIPLDLNAPTDGPVPVVSRVKSVEPDSEAIALVAKMLGEASRPILIAGSNVYADGAWDAMRNFAESTRVAVFTNGMGRGSLPADHELAFSRSRGKAMREADVAVIAGTPFDFRLSFGDRFAADAKVIHLDSDPALISKHRELAVSIGADLDLTFKALADAASRSSSDQWLEGLKAEEDKLLAAAKQPLESDRTPVHPMRIYGELNKFLDRDAIVVCDGGDFVSYAGRELASFVPGGWLDPGPFGCLGVGPGYAIAAKLLHPARQVALLLGDGAFGFSGMEFDTMVRHKLNVVGIMGNNGIWALEKHPMNALFGYDVAATLRQETRYDKVVEALGGYGETVTDPAEIGPALRRAFNAEVPALLNILTDPDEIYPRSANLA